MAAGQLRIMVTGSRLVVADRTTAERTSDVIEFGAQGTADTALRLARYFDMTPQFWMDLQPSITSL